MRKGRKKNREVGVRGGGVVQFPEWPPSATEIINFFYLHIYV